MGQNKVTHILLCVNLILFILIIALMSYDMFETSWKCNYDVPVFDIFSLVITVILTIFTAWYLTKKLSEERFYKEMFISDLRYIEECVNSILNDYQIHSESQILLGRYNQLWVLINRFNDNIESKVDIKSIKDATTVFYKCGTNYGGEAEISDLNIPEIQHMGNLLIKELRKTILDINNK